MRELERLHVCVGGDEFHALQVGLDHPVHGIATAAAYADDLNAGSAHGLFVILNAHLPGFVFLLFHSGSGLLILD